MAISTKTRSPVIPVTKSYRRMLIAIATGEEFEPDTLTLRNKSLEEFNRDIDLVRRRHEAAQTLLALPDLEQQAQELATVRNGLVSG